MAAFDETLYVLLHEVEFVDGTFFVKKFAQGTKGQMDAVAKRTAGVVLAGFNKQVKDAYLLVMPASEFAAMEKDYYDMHEEKLTDIQMAFLEEYSAFKDRADGKLVYVDWIYITKHDVNVSVYLRKGRRTIDGRIEACLEIGNISIEPTGCGVGSKILDTIEQYNPFRYTFIENVLNPTFADYLHRKGWKLHSVDAGVPSFYKAWGDDYRG